VPTVAFITSAEIGGLTADDRLVVAPLAARGVKVEAAIWTEPVAWDAYDLVVIRSPWDWYRDAQRFSALIADLSRRVQLCNHDAQRWLDKRYLARLGERGVRVPHAHVVRDAAELEAKLGEISAPRAVLKPATAAAAHGTRRFDTGDRVAARAALDAILAKHDVALLQPYFDAIETDGEWSVIFLGGEFSHAVKKRPARGDFRVQEEHGGTNEPAVASQDIIDEARRALEASGEDFLYARVDGIVIPELGGFSVTELEVVEPELFLRMDPLAPQRFADAIGQRLRLS
jgi:glutathione synthase/RimK-type ligase-like ATP-grasp enzyme